MDEEKKPEQKAKIVKFNRGFQFNVGIILAIIFIMYMGFHVFSSITRREVTAYEVTLGTIVEKNYYQGLILRSEEIVTADRDGVVYYYEKNKSRVGVKSRVYATDTSGSVVRDRLNGNEGFRMVSAEELSDIYPTIDSFVGNFKEINFYSTYLFKNDINDYLQDIRSRGLTTAYAAEIEQAKASGTFFDHYAIKPGFLVYALDGYEGLTYDLIQPQYFNAGGLSQTNLRSNESITAGNPVYKLVLSDDWQIMIPVDAAKAAELSDMTTIKIRFTQDNSQTWANSEIVRVGDSDYLLLSLDDSMERYADQRFVNIELLLDETRGLKIPNSAIVEKEFFVIPKTYFFAGGNSSDEGLLVRREREADSFVIPTIYYETEDMYYIDDEYVSEGDKLVMENSANTITVGESKEKLFGVYNINKGYAAFRRIEVTYQNEDYSIVRNQASYSISLYDHIVLDSSTVKENEII